jgi:uncharacterized protein YyaL (SSP411 family)
MKNIQSIDSAIEWLKLAQDKTLDGGVSAWFSLITGWRPSYIETTGYIINTFFDVAEFKNDDELKKRAIYMSDFLVSMQLNNGAYRAYTPQQKISDKVVVFDMGQNLLGMTQAYDVTKDKKYLNSAVRAAYYLVNIQNKDGSWTKNTYGNTSHVYHTRVAWGLLKVYKISKLSKFKYSALKNLKWAKGFQKNNGWFENNNLILPNSSIPFTHTISYALEGFMWSGLLLKNPEMIKTVLRGSIPILNYFVTHNFLPASLTKNWTSTDRYTCLTGNAQISLVWLELYKITKDIRFLNAANKMNTYLKSKQLISTPFANINGAIAGSDPIYGDLLKNQGYCRFAYLNWSTKFFIDSLLTEEKILENNL